MSPEGKRAPPGLVGQARQAFVRGKNCLLRAMEDCGGNPAAVVDRSQRGIGGAEDRQKSGRLVPAGPSLRQWAEADVARPGEVAWVPFRASWDQGKEGAKPGPHLVSAGWKAGLPAAPPKGRRLPPGPGSLASERPALSRAALFSLGPAGEAGEQEARGSAAKAQSQALLRRGHGQPSRAGVHAGAPPGSHSVGLGWRSTYERGHGQPVVL